MADEVEIGVGSAAELGDLRELIRYYQRRGLVPGELTMYRIASPDR